MDEIMANNKELDEVAKQIGDAKTNIEDCSNKIYDLINGLESSRSWTGQAYNSFASQCNSFKPFIDELIFVLETYSNYIKKVSSNAEATIHTVEITLSSFE